jgi:hypothetical protein
MGSHRNNSSLFEECPIGIVPKDEGKKKYGAICISLDCDERQCNGSQCLGCGKWRVFGKETFEFSGDMHKTSLKILKRKSFFNE